MQLCSHSPIVNFTAHAKLDSAGSESTQTLSSLGISALAVSAVFYRKYRYPHV